MDDARPARLLVVEDDDRVRASLRLALIDEGWTVEPAADAHAALDAWAAEEADLILLDVRMPGMSGLDFCRTIRTSSAVPIIMLTARDDSHDIVAGLEAGADDYVTKPYNVKELAARIRSLLRRTQGMLPGTASPENAPDGHNGPDERRFGDLVLWPERGSVSIAGEPVSLTKTEFHLLLELVAHERAVLSREQLPVSGWGYDYYGDVRVVDAHVRRLRTKIEPDPSQPTYVHTVRGLGYRFDPESAS